MSKFDPFTALLSSTLSSMFSILHRVSLYLLAIGASSHASSSVAPSQSGSRLPQRNAAYRTSAFAHFILSCRGNHSFLLSQPGLLLFRVMLLEICGDVSGYCSAWGCFCTQWAAGSSHNKCPPELGKFPCQEGLSYSKS